MSLPLRITYKDTDINFSILGEKPSSNTNEINILLDGKELKLIRSDKTWNLSDTEEESLDRELINAIGKAISLRYRF